jgi:3-hydroxyacyl-[acyl-carrier-protein] dehydratase
LHNISHNYLIPLTHPCLAGHFPANPVVPGVVLLDYARDLLQQWQPTLRLKTLSQVKFLQPLYPEQPFKIHLTQISAQVVKFDCVSEQHRLLFGTFIVESR